MNKKRLDSERLMAIFAFIFLTVSCIVSLFIFDFGRNPRIGHTSSILPHTEIVLPLIHGICAMGSLVVFFTANFSLELIILFIESELTILTGMNFLGISLFYGFVIVSFIKNFFTEKNKTIIVLFFGIHLLTIFLYLLADWKKGIVLFAGTLFFMTFYLWIYNLLKKKLTDFLPKTVTENTVIQQRQAGTTVYLSDYNLSERQINLIYDCVVNNASYKDLSSTYYVSISTVKKEFADAFRHFDVTKIDELKYLLSQFKLEKEHPKK